MSESTDTEAFVKVTAAAIGLPIPADALPGVVFDIERLRRMADLLMAHPLATSDEALPILRHD